MTATRILLAPGASGNPAQLAPYRTRLAARGFDIETVALPKGKAERAMPVYAEALGGNASTTVIGGQSFGGRVASLIAPETRPAAVVCLSYPLHAPGRQPTWAERSAHWPEIACPVLLLSGESDPFADIGLLRRAVEQLPHGVLVTYPGQGHSLSGVADAAVDAVVAFLEANT